MKKLILLLTLSAGTLLSPATGNSLIFPKSLSIINSQADEIDLRGRIEPGEIRKEAKAISAYLGEANLKAKFHFDMGSVQIKIVDDIGNTVYTSTVASSIGEILIPLSNLSSGNYSISFTATGGVMIGDFAL